jgi:aminoglycoside phosphotransferase (APT) family kinase protein
MSHEKAPTGLRETPGGTDVDTLKLSLWMKEHIPGFRGEIDVRQFAGGQSNPTFLVQAGDRRYVLRRKPPGKLLPSAHAVDREFRVLAALEGSDVPVARAYALCEDPDVIGSAFYVMDYVEGRIFWDDALPETDPAERTLIYMEMVRVLAALHALDYGAIGMASFGKPGAFIERQVALWTRQYRAAETEQTDAMERLIEWLPRHIPANEQSSIVHGDFRLDNTIFHPSEPRILAVLDWELSTIGHPLVDLAYLCMRYHLPSHEFQGLGGLDLGPLSIPSEAECVAAYCRIRGIEPISSQDWAYYLAFCMFRLASILQGILSRALQGNASSANALAAGRRARPLAQMGWQLVQESYPGDGRA